MALSLLLKSGPEANRAMPCVLGALRNINPSQLNMGQSLDSGGQEAGWALAARGRQEWSLRTRIRQSPLQTCRSQSSLTGVPMCEGVTRPVRLTPATRTSPPQPPPDLCLSSVLTKHSLQPVSTWAPLSTCSFKQSPAPPPLGSGRFFSFRVW